MRDADLALNEAKAAGPDRLVLFEPAMRARTADRLALQAHLRQAIAQSALTRHCQPVFRLDDGALSGF